MDAPDDYLDYQTLTDWLRGAERRHPDLVDLRSIGRTPEDRDIWVAAVADRSEGAPDDRPAHWVDGNLHAAELMGSTVCLRVVHRLVEDRGDPAIAELLRRRTLYVAPRLNPDGAEWCIETGRFVRSARRPYPESRPRRRFVECDVDGDGEVLQMRVPSETGAWRLSDEDDRLLVPRKPWDREGPFYDLYAEGRFSDEAADDPRRPVDGDPHGLDFNRNFPYRWQPEQRQSGAGDYPTSEPEVRAVVDFLTDHRNVFGAISLHTLSGVLLRPFSDRPDAELPDFDRAVYEELGERCEERTGYESASAYHEFRAEGEEPIRGAFDDWAYNDLGIQAFTFELWSPWREAGLDFTGEYPRFFRHRSEEENLALLTWNDDELDGEAFVDWRSFDHPQLGRVEIGGWRRLYSLRNAPPSLLGERADRASAFVIDHARSGPDPRLSLEAERLEGELWRVRARLENHGYLPTDATRRARNQSADPPLHLELESPDGLELVEGEAHRRTHHLDGYANVNRPDRSAFTWRGETREHVDRHTWLLRGEGAVRVVWRGEGIGELEASVDLTPES